MDAKSRGIPIVASMGNVAASGGYWISTAADRIIAEPSTITGSIGVFGILPSFENSLAKIGITPDGVKTTRSVENTSELKSLLRTSYAVYYLTKQNQTHK